MLGALAALLVGLVAVGGRSFWIDELLTAERARQPDLSALWSTLRGDNGSEVQMPLYMAAVWLWEKLAGHGEHAMRSLNLLFLVPAAALWTGGLPGRLRWAGLAVLLSSPFLWHYLNEARPYALQIAATLAAAVAAYRWHLSRRDGRPSTAWCWLFAAALFALASSSLLGAVWTAFGWTAFALLTARHFPLFRQPDRALVTSALLLLPLAAYYAWTLLIGAGATKAFGSGITTLAFSVYELLGFSGHGPGRLELREQGPGALFGFALIPLSVHGLFLALAFFLGLRSLRELHLTRVFLVLAGFALGGLALIWGAGLALHFRVLGRHLAPLLPLLLLPLAAALATLRSRDKRSAAPVLAFLALSFVSCLGLRFAPRHATDDYRGAVAAAGEFSEGKHLWWNAEKLGLSLYDPTLLSRTSLIVNQAPEELAQLPAPSLVVTSKPDIYDRDGHLAKWLKHNGFTPVQALPAFVVWQRKN